MRHDVDDVRRVLIDDMIPGHLGLEAERRALDRGIDALGGEVREQRGHLLGVLAALRRLPVRLVDVFLDDLLLEDAVDEGVGRVEIEVLVGEKLLERGALGRVRGQGRGRGRGRPQADAKLLVRRHARLHRRQIGVDALPELIPVVGGVHQRRVREVAEAVSQIHEGPCNSECNMPNAGTEPIRPFQPAPRRLI